MYIIKDLKNLEIIIVDEDAELSYIEGCTAVSYSQNSLHAFAMGLSSRFHHSRTMSDEEVILKTANNSENSDDTEATLSGIGLYISSAIEEEAPSYNYDIEKTIEGKEIREYEEMAPPALVSEELERYKNSVLKVTRVRNGVTYVEYYYYLPDEDGVWRRHQYHNLQITFS